MTVPDEELLISGAPEAQSRKFSSRLAPSQSILIECQAEERHFPNSSPLKIKASVRPIRFTMDDKLQPDQYRSEIIIHRNPDINLYIKKLHIGYPVHDDLSINIPKNQRSSSRSHSLHVQQEKPRSTSVPRSNSQAMLHQWIDDIFSNEKLMANDDICFFLKNGEFLARI